MKIKCTLWAAMAALLFASCSKDLINNEAEVPAGAKHALSIKATMPEFDAQGTIGESEETRAVGQSVIRLQWAAGDQVSVINLTTGKALAGNLSADQAGITTTFSGTVTGTVNEGDKIALLYPAQGYETEQDFTASIDFSEQTGSEQVQIAAYGTFDYTEGDFDAAQAKFQFLMSYVRMNMTDLSVKHVNLEKDIEEVIITGLPTGMTLAWDSAEQEIIATPNALGKITLTPNVKPADNGSKTLFFTTPAASGASERTVYVKQKYTTWRAAQWSTADLRAKGLYNTIVNKYTVAEDQHIAMPAAEDIVWAQNFDLFTMDALEAATGNADWDLFVTDEITPGASEDLSRVDRETMAELWTAAGVRSLESSPKLYAHVGCIKLGNLSTAGDVAFSLPTLTEPTNLRIVLKASAYFSNKNNSLDGPCPIDVNVGGGGKAITKEFTVENYTYPEWAQTYAERANYQTIEVYIKGATASSTIQLKAARDAKCRIYIDEIVVARDLTTVYPPESTEFEGLPLHWSFPDDGLETGVVTIVNTKNAPVYRVLSDENPDARIDISIAKYSGNDANVYKVNYTLDGKKTNGMCFYSWVEDDYVIFTAPVKNMKSGMKLRFYGWMSGSAKGSRFIIMEYSTDNKATWTAVNTKTGSFGTADGTTVPEHDITYTVLLANTANKAIEIDETFTVNGDIEDGNFYLRLRVCDPLSLDMTRNNGASAAGLNRLFYIRGEEPVSITVVKD